MNCRYLQMNCRYLQFNCRYLQIDSIWRYLQMNCRYLQLNCRYLQFIWRYLQFIWRYLQFNWRYLQLSLFEDISNSIGYICKSIEDICNSVNKCENGTPYLSAFCQISWTWVSKFSFESISIPSSLTDREGFIVTFPTAKLIVSGFFIPSTIAWNLSDLQTCSFQWTKTACLLCLSQELFWETQHPLLLCSVYCRLHSHTGRIHGRSRIYRSWIYWRGVAPGWIPGVPPSICYSIHCRPVQLWLSVFWKWGNFLLGSWHLFSGHMLWVFRWGVCEEGSQKLWTGLLVWPQQSFYCQGHAASLILV